MFAPGLGTWACGSKGTPRHHSLERDDTMSFDEAWELSSGLPLAGATVTVSAVDFGYRQNIFPDTVFCNLTFDVEGGEPREQSYSVGGGYEAKERGKRIERVDGKNKGVSDQSNYGKFIKAALAVPGVKAYLQGINADPLVAATWEGMRFVLGSIEHETTNKNTDTKSKKQLVVPVEFLGVGADEKLSTPAKAPQVDPTDLDPALTATLLELAGNSADHDTFMAAAFSVEGVEGNAAAENAVMQAGKGSIWAKSQA